MSNNKLGDLYTQLKSTIVGTKTQKTDAVLDKAVKDIISYKSHSGRNGYIDLVRTVIAKSSTNIPGLNQGSSLFAQSQTGPQAFGQGIRLMRYKTYDAIVTNINYAYRALQVLVDNILSPDDITKVSLDVKPKQYLESEVPNQSKVKRLKEIIRDVNLEERLEEIIKNTLLYGDFFCEIAPPKVALTSKSILSESQNYHSYVQKQISEGIKQVWTETYESDKKNKSLKISIDYSSFMESKEEKPPKLKDLSLVFHRPQLVIKLQSGLYPLCFGYLVFPAVKGITVSGSMLEDDAINNICKSILKNIESKIPQMTEFKDYDELEDILKFMVKKTDPNQALEIRYVPPDRMTHFKRPSTKFYPYGESIFDASQFSAKVLMALQTALAVQRLSRSTEKRKIAIEVGLPRDAKKAIENMKEELRKRKISLDSFGTIDTIPSMITTFEDVYIPQKDGKPFVDISTFNEGNVDVRSKTDELRFMRDQLTATWGVPPSFLGIEENLSNKAALSEENILFARTVINHQKYFSHQLTELLENILALISPEESLTFFENVDVHLPTPKSLQYEREARYMNELVGLIEGLERIGIPKEYSKKKYLSNYNWEDIKKYEIDQKVDQSLDPSKKDDEMGGLGGMGTGSGGIGF